MEPTSPGKPRWGQSRRLAFIDQRLQFDGRINRRDLIEFFDISTPQASADLALYQSMSATNLRYDPSARVYLALESFKPLYGREASTSYLDEIHRLARGVVEPGESFVGFIPPTGFVATPSRAVDATDVAVLVRAIRDRAALQVRYQSMDNPTSLSLVISPHAMGFDGLRWHARAWCHERGLFRDFAIGRMRVERTLTGMLPIDPMADAGWHTHVSVVLEPHPRLSLDQRDVVIHDYGMTQGRLLLTCRKAMLFYTLRHLNLEALTEAENPATQHVVVKNRSEVARWVSEDRDGVVTPMVG